MTPDGFHPKEAVRRVSKEPVNCLAYRAVGYASFTMSCGASPLAARVHTDMFVCEQTLLGIYSMFVMSSSTTNGNISMINTDNIIKPALDELSKDQCQAYEVIKKQHEEEIAALRKKKEEEYLQAFLATFKKDHQGNIVSTREVNLPPLL